MCWCTSVGGWKSFHHLSFWFILAEQASLESTVTDRVFRLYGQLGRCVLSIYPTDTPGWTQSVASQIISELQADELA